MGWTALLDKNDKQIGTVGDKGWDLAGTFVTDFLLLYKKELKKTATLKEIEQSIRFVYKTCVKETEEIS